ncbi:DNA/RNA non-specific endonuclease [Catalinimonas niigatensis]|uniref:DNA/RNA non-specific endonuclease n=1 Tax=Catalinimonas niigatensis TaxID=1397264 RepID=UPI0026668A1A|nr:DNA/RNA non-specific endonuclease [Catalinimonas niigatensis]WPP49098.1 DNA/RNA non-specific endonuclease [Catalinimonas niigatensis]
MAKKSTRYLLLVILIVAVFIILLVLLKGRQESPAPTERTQAEREVENPAAKDKSGAGETTVAFDYLPRSVNQQIIRHQYITLSYVEKHEQAEWVAYELTGREVQGIEERTDDFREDPMVKTGSATLEDYYRSGYDRGHLAPAGDMKFSEEAMSESFFMSNMSPQLPEFNRGIWRLLEEQVREWALENGKLFVVTGPVFNQRSRRIGDNKVSIPKAYYKVLLDYTEPEIKAIGFLLPNEGSDKDIFTFAVPIDSIEKVTQIDFFPALPEQEEVLLESEVEVSLWIGASY